MATLIALTVPAAAHSEAFHLQVHKPGLLERVSSGPAAAPLPEDAARAVQVGALGEWEGQAALEPARVDGWGAPDGARQSHHLPGPAHQGPRALCPLLNGGRHWGREERKKQDVRASGERRGSLLRRIREAAPMPRLLPRSPWEGAKATSPPPPCGSLPSPCPPGPPLPPLGCGAGALLEDGAEAP